MTLETLFATYGLVPDTIEDTALWDTYAGLPVERFNDVLDLHITATTNKKEAYADLFIQDSKIRLHIFIDIDPEMFSTDLYATLNTNIIPKSDSIPNMEFTLDIDL